MTSRGDTGVDLGRVVSWKLDVPAEPVDASVFRHSSLSRWSATFDSVASDEFMRRIILDRLHGKYLDIIEPRRWWCPVEFYRRMENYRVVPGEMTDEEMAVSFVGNLSGRRWRVVIPGMRFLRRLWHGLMPVREPGKTGGAL